MVCYYPIFLVLTSSFPISTCNRVVCFHFPLRRRWIIGIQASRHKRRVESTHLDGAFCEGIVRCVVVSASSKKPVCLGMPESAAPPYVMRVGGVALVDYIFSLEKYISWGSDQSGQYTTGIPTCWPLFFF